jgi:hypothetical protein
MYAPSLPCADFLQSIIQIQLEELREVCSVLSAEVKSEA